MNKPYYADFVRHCLRYYCQYHDPKFRSEADKKNWFACRNALNGFPDAQREQLKAIYAEGDILADTICQMERKTGQKQDEIWKLVYDLEHKVAKRRGLI